MRKILVTGAGAVLGQGILRCLREHKDKYQIHTADPDVRSTGHWLGDKAHTILFANDPQFINSIEEIIIAENIDAILVGTDAELPIFSKQKTYLESNYQLSVVVSDERVIEIANDKWLTANYLKANNFPFPLSYMSNDIEGIKHLKELNQYPYIAKPVDGARSKGLLMINTERDLDQIASYANNLVVQEYISEDEGEFTSGCLVFGGECKVVVTLKRDLRDGNTYRAYYDKTYEKYGKFIAQISESLNIFGPSNFQFRVKNGVPIIFEINSRFSGTTPIRSFFGFNEVVATLDYLFENKNVVQPKLKSGVIMRAWADIFVEEKEMEVFKSNNSLQNPTCVYHPFFK